MFKFPYILTEDWKSDTLIERRITIRKEVYNKRMRLYFTEILAWFLRKRQVECCMELYD